MCKGPRTIGVTALCTETLQIAFGTLDIGIMALSRAVNVTERHAFIVHCCSPTEFACACECQMPIGRPALRQGWCQVRPTTRRGSVVASDGAPGATRTCARLFASPWPLAWRPVTGQLGKLLNTRKEQAERCPSQPERKLTSLHLHGPAQPYV